MSFESRPYTAIEQEWHRVALEAYARGKSMCMAETAFIQPPMWPLWQWVVVQMIRFGRWVSGLGRRQR